MIRKLVFFITLLYASTCFAGIQSMHMAVVAKKNVVAETCGSGTPPLLLYWKPTSTTMSGSAGCSSGDTTATPTGEIQLSGGWVDVYDTSNNGGDYYELAVTSNDIFPAAAFTVEFKINLSVAHDQAAIVQVLMSSNDYTYIRVKETDDIEIYRVNNTATDINSGTTGNYISPGTTYYVVVRASTTDGPDFWISSVGWPTVNTGGSWTENNDVLTSMSDGTGTVRIGNNKTYNQEYTLQEIKIYNGWKTY